MFFYIFSKILAQKSILQQIMSKINFSISSIIGICLDTCLFRLTRLKPMFSFNDIRKLYSLKSLENNRFSDYFKGYRNNLWPEMGQQSTDF